LKSKGRTLERFTYDINTYIHNNHLTNTPPRNTAHPYVAHLKRSRENDEETNTDTPPPSQDSDRLDRIEKLLNAVSKGKGKKSTGDDKKRKKEGNPASDAPHQYCYKHGFGNHNGRACRNFDGKAGEDYLKDATADNTMGGSTKVWKPRK
jgi:hypothetical protein